MKNIIGVDIGGTTIKGGLIESGEITKQIVSQTKSNEGGDVTLNILKNLIRSLINSKTKSLGIGVPSVVDRIKGVVYNVQNIKDWEEIHLKDILESEFNLPVFIDNDANCFAMGEKKYGRGKQFDNFVGITLGTGVGGGIIQNGKLLRDANCGSGEFGELLYLDSILENYCGSRFFNKFNMSGLDVAKKAALGDEKSFQIFDEYGKHIAALVKSIVLTIDPQAIIFGGAIANSLNLFEKSMYRHLDDFPYPNSIKNLKILQSRLDNIGILGAGALNN